MWFRLSWVRIPSSTLEQQISPVPAKVWGFLLCISVAGFESPTTAGCCGGGLPVAILPAEPQGHLPAGTFAPAKALPRPRRGNPIVHPLFLFTPLTCLRYACRRRVRFPLQSALMTPNWVKTTLCRHSVALCTSTVTLSPPQCPETPITY